MACRDAGCITPGKTAIRSHNEESTFEQRVTSSDFFGRRGMGIGCADGEGPARILPSPFCNI